MTAVAFGVCATMVIGIVGLGTEGGTWYVTRRAAQNAADTAAYAGAVRLATAQYTLGLTLANAQTQARTTATDDATRNGFTSGVNSTVVTPNTPPVVSTLYAGNTSAVEVVVQRTRPRLLSALFLTTNPVIRARGVAALTSNGPACVLALSSGLTIQGSSNVQTPSCTLASNATGASAINFNGGATVNAVALDSAGGCNSCGGLTMPVLTYQPPTTDPYAALNNITYTRPTGSNCLATPPQNGNGTYQIATPTAGQGFCSNVQLSGNNRTWNFAPGTYVFWNSSLQVSGGSLTCTACTGGAGVTLIFTGSAASQVGTVTINTGGIVSLTAPSSGTYAGVLIYRDDLGTNTGNPQVQITGGPSLTLSGALYAPTSYADFNGNSATNCLMLVAAQVRISGTSNFSTAGCPTGTGRPTTQIVRLME